MKETQNVFKVYDKIASWFDKNRGQDLMEKAYLDYIIQSIPKQSHVLDLGCGTGKPILSYLLEHDMQVTAVDASKAILDLAIANFPDTEFILEDMRKLDLDRKYDALIAWHSFFHLSQDDQIKMFPIFEKHLKPEGFLLFTAGPDAGEAWGTLDGEQVYHASLSPEKYQSLLEEHGFQIIQQKMQDPDCGNACIWLAQLQ